MMVSQLMSNNLVTCRPEDSLSDAAERMWDHDIGCLPVVDTEGHVIGMVTDRDACMAAFTQGRPLGAIDVGSAMAHQVFSCLPTASVEEAEAIMRQHQVRRLPVIDQDGKLAGLIALGDVARESTRQLSGKMGDVSAQMLATTLASICAPRQGGGLTIAASAGRALGIAPAA